MLVLDYLQNNTLEELAETYKIEITRHSTLPIKILNYTPVSERYDPLTRECRSLIIDDDGWFSRSFTRFFNLGEYDDGLDWNNHICFEKIDGSLIHVCLYKGERIVTTKRSFCDKTIQDKLLWRDVIDPLLPKLDPELSYSFELTSPYNQVVAYHTEPKLTLLAAFLGDIEIPCELLCLPQPKQYKFSGLKEIREFLQKKDVDNGIFEGFVLRDWKFDRLKVKGEKYLRFHKIKGNGFNLSSKEYIVSAILEGETGEILSVFPDAKDIFQNVSSQLDGLYHDLVDTIEKVKCIDSRKDYAMQVKSHPLSAILFRLKDTEVSENQLNKTWHLYGSLLSKQIK